jgi:hypothetical protein
LCFYSAAFSGSAAGGASVSIFSADPVGSATGSASDDVHRVCNRD